jgi:hypothetical protein
MLYAVTRRDNNTSFIFATDFFAPTSLFSLLYPENAGPADSQS